jgi:DNA-binding NarL/FixJ family response regulator
MKILLVEDNPGDARLLQEMLKEADATHLELSFAESLSDALQIIGEKHFDIILLDLALPDSLGIETFKKVHAQAPDVPVVVLSGFDDETFAVKAVKAGAKGYLSKNNIDIDLLEHTIKDAVKSRGSST